MIGHALTNLRHCFLESFAHSGSLQAGQPPVAGQVSMFPVVYGPNGQASVAIPAHHLQHLQHLAISGADGAGSLMQVQFLSRSLVPVVYS